MNIEFLCDRFNVAREVPLLVNEAQSADHNGIILFTRFLHNKLTFTVNGYLNCYSSYLSPHTIASIFSLFGLVLFFVGLYYLAKKKRWLFLGSLLIGPALPLVPFYINHRVIALIMYLPQLLVILVGLLTIIQGIVSLASTQKSFFIKLKSWIAKSLNVDFLVFCLLISLIPIFLYNLGGFSLADFDEGWYAGVAVNLLHRQFVLPPYFNGVPFFDHPPFGFILMAVSYVIFGISEFAARFPSAILGFGSLILTYFIGKKIFSRSVGLMSSFMLSSSVWFIFRARSGNLDSPFLFFYLLTFLSATLASGSVTWSIILGLSLGLLLLTKSLIGLSVIPGVAILLWTERHKNNSKNILLSGVFLIIPLLLWAAISFQTGGWQFFNRMLAIGSRSGGREIPAINSILSSNTMTYLHSGIGHWYYLCLGGLVAGLLFLKRKPKVLAAYSIIAILLGGFITNKKTEIWHLIPLYPFFFLLASAFFEKSLIIANKIFRLGANAISVSLAATLIIIFLSLNQIYSFKDGVHLFDRGETDFVYVAKQARKYDGPLYLDGNDFFPSVVYYSGKDVKFLRTTEAPYNSLRSAVDFGRTPALIMTESWRLRTDHIERSKYELLDQRGESTLIRIKNQ
jgi:hypothetical protein